MCMYLMLRATHSVFSLVNKMNVDEANRRIEENRRENKRLITLNKQRKVCTQYTKARFNHSAVCMNKTLLVLNCLVGTCIPKRARE